MDTFSEWLSSELKKRGWKQADLARETGYDSAVISNLINERRGPGEETCRAIARAFHLPPEEVFRRAKLLPPKPESDPFFEELLNDYNNLSESYKSQAIDYLKFLRERQDREEKETQRGIQPSLQNPKQV